MRVLLIEDEKGVRDGISTALRASGIAVDVTGDLRSGRAFARSHRYDCVICDRMLPDGDGIDFLEGDWRGVDPAPVLMLTARDALRDRVAGIERGADDYLGKPFAMTELIARVRMLARRRESITPSRVKIGDLEIDSNRREVRRSGVVLSLTAKEFAVIELLASRPGTVTSRDEITEQCWDRLTEPMSNAVDVVISQLRGKLGSPSPIRTVRGAGYVLEEES